MAIAWQILNNRKHNAQPIAADEFSTCEDCPLCDTEHNYCLKKPAVKANYRVFPYDCPLQLGGEAQ